MYKLLNNTFPFLKKRNAEMALHLFISDGSFVEFLLEMIC